MDRPRPCGLLGCGLSPDEANEMFQCMAGSEWYSKFVFMCRRTDDEMLLSESCFRKSQTYR
jgi:hypothetical protein